MSFKDDLISDLDVFYSIDEFAKKCIFKDEEVSVLFQSDEMDIFEVSFERIKGKKSDFAGIQEGDILQIESKSYTVMNFSDEKDYQISISISIKER